MFLGESGHVPVVSSPLRRRFGATVQLIPALLIPALAVAGCSRTQGYADRDWSAIDPVAADIPQVREPDEKATRTNLDALDPCAVGAAGDPDAVGAPAPPPKPGKDVTCTSVRAEGTVEVITAARYFVDGTGPDAINALDDRVRSEIAGFAVWTGPGPVTPDGPNARCAVVVPASLELGLVILDEREDCTAATAAATAALGDLPSVTRAGQHVTVPVFYAADEPDPGGAGACAELGDQLEWLCAPVGQVDVPKDPVDLIRHGEADPGMLCTPALLSVRATAETDGRTWVGMTTAVAPQDLDERTSYDGPRQCTLLEAKDRADADSAPVTIIVTARRQPLETSANTDVAGHPAYHSKLSGTWEVALTKPTEHGYLSIDIVDDRREEPAWAKKFVADLVKRVF